MCCEVRGARSSTPWWRRARRLRARATRTLTRDPGRRTDTRVYLLFLDESGQLSERRFFALGGVVLRDHDWHLVRDLWQETLAAHEWPLSREIKWHGIRTGEVPPPL